MYVPYCLIHLKLIKRRNVTISVYNENSHIPLRFVNLVPNDAWAGNE